MAGHMVVGSDVYTGRGIVPDLDFPVFHLDRYRVMIVRALALLALLTAVLGSRPADTQAAHGLSDSSLLRTAAARLGTEPQARVLHWLRRHSTVLSAGVGKDDRTVDVRFRDGREMAVLSRQVGTVHLEGATRQFHFFARANQSADARAAVLEPFATELGLGANPGAPVAGALQSAGFSVDEGVDTQVSVGFMATLPQYNVVYMHTHSGITQSGGGVVATGQFATNDPSVQPYLADGSVMVIGVAGSNAQYFGITSRFVSQHMPTFRSRSLIFINGCALLQTSDFWSALSQKGAGVLVSWNADSTNSDNYLSGIAFFNVMQGNGSSVSGAIAILHQNGYGTSAYNGQTATLGSVGDGNITLAQAAASTSPPPTVKPTATSVATATQIPEPTRTPTPTEKPTPRPTSTTIPTATSTPTPVPLAIIGIQPSVQGGKDQAFDVHGPAGKALQVRVRYPNGDVRNQTVQLGSGGTAHVQFKQPTSTITRKNRTAVVRLSGPAGTGGSQLTASYTVGFGKIDVSAQPRSVARGGTIVLWVHAHAHKAVTVKVEPVHRALDTMKVVTGKQGWARVRYTIGHGRKHGAVLTVAAQVTSGRKHPYTATTITVR